MLKEFKELAMLREQVRRTPPPQWVRVIGGWTEFQFAERRMPTLEEIKGIESVLTIVGGKVVYAVEEFGSLAPPPLPVSPDWSPVGAYGHYHSGTAASATFHKRSACHPRRQVWLSKESRFWRIDCDCFAF
jgi:hypothetical protein